MKSISVTTLEKFRRVINEMSSYDTIESLIETLKGVYVPGFKADTGNLLHKVAETGIINQVIPEMLQAPILNYHSENEMSSWEVPLLFEFAGWVIRGRVDSISGNVIHDLKITFRDPDWKSYSKSVQWKLYLLGFEANQFQYDVFQLTDENLNKAVMIAHDPLTLYRFSGMENEVTSLLNSFQEFLNLHDLNHLIKQL